MKKTILLLASVFIVVALAAQSQVLPPMYGTVSAGGGGDMTKAVYDSGDDGAADTANALAANGADCAAGTYALGVDAAGAATGCTDATTEIDSAIATHAALDTAHYGEVQVIPFDFTTDVATGDGAFYFHIGQQHAGKAIVYAHAEVVTAGTTGVLEVMIAKNGVDVFDASHLEVDTTPETGSDTAASPYTLKTDGTEDVAENDVIRIDVDTIHSAVAPKGLIITIGFE